MAKFKKKPVVINAVQLRTVDINDQLIADGPMFDELPEWLFQAIIDEKVAVYKEFESDYAHLVIHTLEGQHLARPGDWIICGTHGELYPCKPDIFSSTHEVVEEGGMIKPDLIYILAKDYNEIQNYARKHGYTPANIAIVDSAHKLRGIRDINLHVLPNAYLRKDYHQLIDTAKTCRATIKIISSI